MLFYTPLLSYFMKIRHYLRQIIITAFRFSLVDKLIFRFFLNQNDFVHPHGLAPEACRQILLLNTFLNIHFH